MTTHEIDMPSLGVVYIDDVRCIRETDAAIQVVIEGAKHWIPKSQIDDDSEVNEEGDEGQLVITEWIAEQKGLA